MRMQFVISMLVVFWLHILMVAYVNAESAYKGFNIQTYKHRGCVVPHEVRELPEYAHMGIPIKIWHLNNTSEVKHSNESLKSEIKNCREIIKDKQDSCDLALSFQGIAPPDYDARMKCAAQFDSEITKCRAYYDQKFRECDAIRIIPVKTADKTSKLRKKPLFEELIPDDSPSGNWEELKSDDHPYGPEANSMLAGKRMKKDRYIRTGRLGDPEEDRHQQEKNMIGKKNDWEQDKQNDLNDSRPNSPGQPNLSDSDPSSPDRNNSNNPEVDLAKLAELIRQEDDESFQDEGKTPGSPGGGMKPGGAIDRSGRTGRISQSCEQAQRRVSQRNARTLASLTRKSSDQCTKLRVYVQMFQTAHRDLAISGCPASVARTFDRSLAEARQGLRSSYCTNR